MAALTQKAFPWKALSLVLAVVLIAVVALFATGTFPVGTSASETNLSKAAPANQPAASQHSGIGSVPVLPIHGAVPAKLSPLSPQLLAQYAGSIDMGKGFFTRGPIRQTPHYGDGTAPLIRNGQWWHLENNISTYHKPNINVIAIQEPTGSSPLTITFELTDVRSGKVLERPTLVYGVNGIPQSMTCQITPCPGGGRWLNYVS